MNKNHPSLGLSYWNIGFIYDKKEEKDIALDYYQKALEISKYNYGENHVDIGDLYINIGSSYMDKKDYILVVLSRVYTLLKLNWFHLENTSEVSMLLEVRTKKIHVKFVFRAFSVVAISLFYIFVDAPFPW